MKKLSIGIAAIAAGVMGLSMTAQAYEVGDMILRVGAATVDPKEDSDAVKLNGSKVSSLDVSADSNTQVGITGTYIFAPHWGIELLAATPFEHDVDLNSNGDKFIKLGSIKHLPPTLSVQYYFAEATSKFQPYVGLGLNYTTFFDESLTSEAKAAGFSHLQLDDSFGLAVEAGLDYMIDDHWTLNASVWKIDINTTATADLGANRVKVDYELDPLVYMVGIGYKF